jgi:uncharacterized membrane protein
MEDHANRRRRIERQHLRLVNVLARLFGLSAVVAAIGFTAWGIYYFRHAEAAVYVTLSGHAGVDFLAVAIFCLLLALVFLTVRPYRPDITLAGGADVKRRHTWWTGEPR